MNVFREVTPRISDPDMQPTFVAEAKSTMESFGDYKFIIAFVIMIILIIALIAYIVLRKDDEKEKPPQPPKPPTVKPPPPSQPQPVKPAAKQPKKDLSSVYAASKNALMTITPVEKNVKSDEQIRQLMESDSESEDEYSLDDVESSEVTEVQEPDADEAQVEVCDVKESQNKTKQTCNEILKTGKECLNKPTKEGKCHKHAK